MLFITSQTPCQLSHVSHVNRNSLHKYSVPVHLINSPAACPPSPLQQPGKGLVWI